MFNFFIAALIFFANVLIAHPVSFEGSIPVITQNEQQKSEYIAIYSIKYNWGVGAHYLRLQEKVEQSHGAFAMSSVLLKRWNTINSQANIYAWGGAGSIWGSAEHDFALMAGMRADYETRKIFLESNYRRIQGLTKVDYDFFQAQAGLAPYVADYEDLHTWLILRFNYTPQLQQEINLIPMLRFFYKNVFWELGANHKGSMMINTMVHF